jgi:D-glycero-D-manno-heptose 1,7-bisphosphate phosphatase
MNKSRRAVFLDRDGTIIKEVGYLSDPAGVELLPGTAKALKKLRSAGFMLVVVTNQSGIARGYYKEDELEVIHRRLDELLKGQGAGIDAYYFCPHHPEHGEVRDCACRKPKTGMAELAAKEHGIILGNSYFVGDKASDVELGINAGGRSVLVLTGFGQLERAVLENKGVMPDLVCGGLPEAADWILKDSKGSS